MSQRLTDQELTNARHTLALLRSQISAGSIDRDYILRQFDKFSRVLERVEAVQQEQKAAGRFEALYNVSRILGTSLDLQTVLDQVMDAIIQLTGAERSLLMLGDDDGGLSLAAARNMDQQTITNEELVYSRTIANHVLDTGEAVVTTNAVEDPRFAGQASIITQSLRSIMAAPLRARGRIIGVAYVENRVVAGLFGDEDLNTLEALAGQASVAIDNAILFEETDQKLSDRLEQLRLLRRIDLRLNEKLDMDEALQTILDSACRLSDANTGRLGLAEEDHVRLVYQYNRGESSSVEAGPLLDEVVPEAWQTVRSGKALHEATDDADRLIVPLLRKQEVIGVLVLEGPSFSSDDLDLVERIVTRAAVTIENIQLYAAVQAADKAKSEFVGIVAHDLKAPMTGIAGYAELLRWQGANKLNEREQDFINRITGTVKRMEILVSDLADISRIESGQFYMEEIRTTVEDVVSSVRDVIMPSMQEREHTYVEDIEADLPEMWVDFYRLVQVLTNLLSNAYKYTPNGGTITLHVWREDGRIHFAVADTGIGLSPEAIEKLGTKFWRADDDHTRSQPGTGLGFAITASLIEQMGSQISIESEVGKGSRFSFDVAIAEVTSEQSAAAR